LTVEIDKAYVDIANAVNNRIIGIYPTNRPAITGSSYFISSNQRQQSFREVYTFTAAGSIAHGIANFTPVQMINGYGSFTDGTNDYGVIYASSTAIIGQVTFYVTTTNIVVVADGAAPAITSGKIIIEWISSP
jgi:hypothetical protein